MTGCGLEYLTRPMDGASEKETDGESQPGFPGAAQK
jgi:hypothetical protein